MLKACCLLAALWGLFPRTGSASTSVEAISSILDRFHRAAANADGKSYFELFAKNGVFIGTDASERWTVDEFKKYAEPHFSKGRGWTYVSTRRKIDVGLNEEVAWFDEILENKSYGTCRGSGVLYREMGQWRIAQYHLTIPVPNPLAKTVVELIRGSVSLDDLEHIRANRSFKNECSLDPMGLTPELPDKSPFFVKAPDRMKSASMVENVTLKNGVKVEVKKGGCAHLGWQAIFYPVEAKERLSNTAHYQQRAADFMRLKIGEGGEALNPQLASALSRSNKTVRPSQCSEKECTSSFACGDATCFLKMERVADKGRLTVFYNFPL